MFCCTTEMSVVAQCAKTLAKWKVALQWSGCECNFAL